MQRFTLLSRKPLSSAAFRISPRIIRPLNTGDRPSPPRLPKEEQEEFERLQRIANSQAAIDEYNAKISGDHSKDGLKSEIPDQTEIGGFAAEYTGTIPEFEGDVNPKTGEIGGPKQDPLRHGDYSFNGRVTDF